MLSGKSILLVMLILCGSLFISVLFADNDKEEESEGQEFLFLLEEAYLQKDGQWQVGFTSDYREGKEKRDGQEKETESRWLGILEVEYGLTDWMQFSTEIPFQCLTKKKTEDDETFRLVESCVSDIETTLSFLISKEDEDNFFSPTISMGFSVMWPSGNWRQGMGTDQFGFGFGLSASKTLDKFAYHLFFEFECTDDAREAGESGTSDEKEIEFGGALVWEQSDNIDFIIELLGECEREKSSSSEQHSLDLYFSPGFIYELADELETGISIPIGLTSSSYDWGIIAKIQYEW